MAKNNNKAILPTKIENMDEVYNFVKYMTAILGAAFHPEGPIKDYLYKNDDGSTTPCFAPAIAERLQNLLDQAFEVCERKKVDICAIRLSNLMASLKGFDLDALNEEFVELLWKHDGDKDVQGESRGKFMQMSFDDESEKSYFAGNLNAWDELCGNHEGLSDSGLGWFAGAKFVGYDNPFDLYIGDGDEPYIY